MVGPSQAAGWDDWFDFNENSPMLNFYRDFYATWRERVRGAAQNVDPLSPAGNLLHHAYRHFAAHQFEFGCINCGDFYCQDYHKLETVEATCIAVEYAKSPVTEPEISIRDANGDSVDDIILVTPGDLFIFSSCGGRLLYWFDLERGEEISGNELFMWGYYYLGWREFYGGGNFNDDFHYTIDYEWNAPHQYPSAQPFQRFYGIRKKCFNEFFSFGGAPVEGLLNDELFVSVIDDTIRFSLTSADFDFVKKFYPAAGGLSVAYEITNNRSFSRQFDHRVENSFNPSLIKAMDHGRESIKYINDSSDTSSTIQPDTRGVMNVYSETMVNYIFDPEPDGLSGRKDVFALQLNPEYQYTLGGGGTTRYGFSLAAEVATDAEGNDPSPRYPFRLRQNYPNPFNPSTRITYSIGKKGPVNVKIYDVTGRLVRVLVDDIREQGVYDLTWNGTNDGGRHVGSGIYFCRMQSGEFAETRKLVLLR